MKCKEIRQVGRHAMVTAPCTNSYAVAGCSKKSVCKHQVKKKENVKKVTQPFKRPDKYPFLTLTISRLRGLPPRRCGSDNTTFWPTVTVADDTTATRFVHHGNVIREQHV
jgi:hypothetical protein